MSKGKEKKKKGKQKNLVHPALEMKLGCLGERMQLGSLTPDAGRSYLASPAELANIQSPLHGNLSSPEQE